LLYATAAEQRAAMLPFFTEGLARGERCLWIADDRTVDEVRSLLYEAGIDVAAETARGTFMILGKRETYLRNGAFDPRAMIEMLAEMVRETVAKGFTGLRGSGEMTWALGDDTPSDRVIEYEALLNDFIAGKPFVAICQYNRSRFVPSVILDVLRTHHYAVVGELVCPNLYFEPSEMVLGRATDARRLDWRLAAEARACGGAGARARHRGARGVLCSREPRAPDAAHRAAAPARHRRERPRGGSTPTRATEGRGRARTDSRSR
jgi:hypothetical protein